MEQELNVGDSVIIAKAGRFNNSFKIGTVLRITKKMLRVREGSHMNGKYIENYFYSKDLIKVWDEQRFLKKMAGADNE